VLSCQKHNLEPILTEYRYHKNKKEEPKTLPSGNDDWKVLLFPKLPTEPYNTEPIRPGPINQTSEEILMELYRLLEIFVDYCPAR
jgi:hypothetical protein